MDTMRLTLISLLVVLAVSQSDAETKNGFIFTMPKIIRYGSTSEFCLTLHGENKTAQNVTMILEKSGKNVTEVQDVFSVDKQKCRKFVVPKPGKYKLILSNQTGVMHDSVSVTVFSDKLITLVQTDKPMYKPGQTVLFRVLTLMSDLKPRTGKIKSIYVIDPNDIRVKQYLNVETKGISSLEFQLAPEAKLGSWRIQVLVDESDEEDKQVISREFQVMEYVLPRFEVEIIPPPYILANQKNIEVQVCAKYTYGKNVTGFLDLSVCWGSSYLPPKECANEVVQFTGCHIFSTNVANMVGPRYDYFGYELVIKASVTEEGTGAVVNKSHTGPSLSYEPLKIQLDDYSNGFFKPGLPFYGKAIVTKPDGSAAEGELIKITAVDYKNNLRFSKTFTTDSYGVVVYSLCGSFTEKSESIAINAEAESYPSAEGLNTPRGYKQIKQWFSPSLSYIQIPRTDSSHKCGDRLTLSIPFTTWANSSIEFSYQVMAQGKVIKTGQIMYDNSTRYPGKDLILPPSEICLQEDNLTPPPPQPDISATEPTVEIKSDETSVETTLEMRSDESSVEPPTDENAETDAVDSIMGPYPNWRYNHMEEPYYNAYSEPIVRSATVSDTVSNFLLDFAIMPIMSPKFTLLVYYIMPDGEVVADSMQFLVNPCFENEVKMEFSQTSVLPGEVADIKLKAAAGSVCGVGIVDKSVNILGGKHQITPELVFEKIEEFNAAQFDDPSYHYYRDTYCTERIRKLHGDVEDLLTYSSPFVDTMQAFKSSGFLVLSNLNIETRPCAASHIVMYDYNSGTNLDMLPGPMFISSISSPRVPSLSQTSVRSHFPETWLWDLEMIGEEGETVLKETAPHTITTWVGNAMCLHQQKGFGISKLTTLTTFQPFFLSLHLPYAAVRGERLTIMFTVYNYLEKCLHIQLSLYLGKSFKIDNSKQHQDAVCVCGGNSYTAKFYETPAEIGNLAVFAQAEIVPGLCGNTAEVDQNYIGLKDAVTRQLFVKAEGVEQQYTHTSYICSKADEPKLETVILPLPESGQIVKDSARGEVKVIGDIMGPALTNLNNLVRMPTGCGEQNMISFVPNIFVLKYLNSVGRVLPEVQENAIKYMEIGYQRELTYRHKDGSYSAFGENDPQGSVWLTAFVVKSFAQARPYIYIDDKDFTLSLKFLRHSQLETGCFRETGKVLQSYMMGGLGAGKDKESNTALTAYVLTALLNANVSTSEPVIVAAMSCINADFQQKKGKMDPYTLALVAYANSLNQQNSRTAHEVLNVLDSKAQRNGSLRFWSRETSKPKPVNTWYYYAAPSAEVEMTAYGLMAYINIFGKRAIERTHNIAMWLSQQRNPSGGFSSTQDTVVGLQALSEFASLVYSKEGTELAVSISGKQFSESFTVSDKRETTLLLQSAAIQILPNELTITAQGSGCALVQASVHYNKQPKDLQADEKPSFYLKVNAKRYVQNIDKCDRRTISISVGKKGNQDLSNGMSLVSVKMVTSWTPVPESLTKLRSLFPVLGIKRLEYNEQEAVLTLYFDELSRRPREFSFDVEQDKDLAVSSPKPAEVKIFQYYEADVSVVESYELKTICGTKAEIPRNASVTDEDVASVSQMRVDLNLVPAPQRNGNNVCPVCIPIQHEPKNLKEVVCNSTAVYKAIAGRKGAKSLKLLHDLKSQKKDKLNILATYKMADECDCTVLEPPVKRVLIMVREVLPTDKVLQLDGYSMVIISDKKIEKQVRKVRKYCTVKRNTL